MKLLEQLINLKITVMCMKPPVIVIELLTTYVIMCTNSIIDIFAAT